MKNKIIKYFLLVLTVVFGFLAWLSEFRAIKVADSSTWIVPMIFFALYVILLCLSAVLVKKALLINAVMAVSVFFSLAFAPSTGHFVIIIFCIFLLHMALANIRRDMSLNVKISLWKSLGTGKFWLVISLAILISSQYFFIIKKMDGQLSIPEFNTTRISSKIVEPILIFIDPNFEKMQGSKGITVDQFLIESKGEEIKNAYKDSFMILQNLSEEEKEQLGLEMDDQETKEQISERKYQIQEAILKKERQVFSEKIGREVDGKEDVADVFASLVDKKINDYFRMPIRVNSQTPTFIYIFTAVLFFTVWPLGSIICSLCFVLSALIFKLLILCKLVEIRKEFTEREAIIQ
jgi:hypothetical protein